MRVEVRPINDKGRPLFKGQREKGPAFTGELIVRENRLHHLGRAVITAQLLSVTDNARAPLLPELYDAVVLYVEGPRMRIRGFEDVEQRQYAQTWDVKAVECSA